MKFFDTNILAAERGLDVAERYQLQFYDSLLLATAEVNGCNEFISEDLNDGQIYCGMKVVNPFKAIAPQTTIRQEK